MKPRNLIQALWPGILLLIWIPQFGDGVVGALSVIVPALWLCCALALHPRRRWSWWACLAAVGACALLGIGLYCCLIHMFLFPDSPYWADANQPGAIVIIGGTFFLVPSALLLWHLLSIRRHFHETANA